MIARAMMTRECTMRLLFFGGMCLALCLMSAPLCGAERPSGPQPGETPVPGPLEHAQHFVGLVGRTHWINTLTESAKSPDAATRARAAFVLGQACIGADRAHTDKCLTTLSALAGDSDRTVRIHAGIALAHLGVEAATDACAAALVDGPRWRRYYAVAALERIGTPRARRLLVQGVEGQSQYIRDAAEWFLVPPTERPPNPGRKAEYTPAPADSPPPAGTPPEVIFAAAADVLWVLADSYWHTGEHEDCMRLGLAATFLDPSHVDAWGSVAWLTWSAGRDAEAIQIYLDGLHATPSQYDMYFELGFHLYNTHRYRAALPYLRKASELPCPVPVPRTYAHCLEKLGRLSECLEVWARLLEQDPTNPVVARNHARVQRLVQPDG